MSDPTAVGDDEARQLRDWYEANRETWCERHSRKWPPRFGTADNFMLGLMSEADRIKGRQTSAPDLWEALKALHDDCAEYIRINNLSGAFDNHVMKQARNALAKYKVLA